MSLTLIAQVIVMQLWDWHPRVPLSIRGDVYLSMIGIKNTSLTGWWTGNSLMGAPFGQDLHDFPAPGDALNFFILKVMTWFTSDVGLIVNIFWLLTFPMVALSAYIACRGLRVSRPMSIAVSVLYAFVPYHFWRGQAHLFLSSYFALPLLCLLALRQLSDEPLVRLAEGDGISWRRLVHRGNAIGIAIATLVATTGLYYAVFAIVIFAITALVHAMETRRVRDLVPSAALATLIGFALAIQMLPTVLYQRANGDNPGAVVRSFGDIEFFSLNLSHMLLPVVGHRISTLAEIRATSTNTPIPGEGMETLGFIGAVGLLVLLATPILALAGREIARGHVGRTIKSAAVVALACYLVATIGGASSILGAFGRTEIRAWNRMSIVIAFLALLTVGLLVDRLLERTPKPRLFGIAAAGLLVAVGLYDQTTPGFIPPYDQVAKTWNEDGQFIAAIEQTIGPGASVFQLPIARFPENGALNALGDYDLSIGYLHSDTLEWSYGGMKGRESEWQDQLHGLPNTSMLREVAIAGFDGIYIDRRGYGDRASELENDLTQVLGPPSVTSPDTNQTFFDIREYRMAVERELGPGLAQERDRVIRPPLRYLDGFYASEFPNGTTRLTWARESAELLVDNRSGGTREAELSFDYGTTAAGAWTLTLAGPGFERTFPIGGGETRATVDFEAPPGETTIHFSTTAPTDTLPDARDLHFRLVNVDLHWDA